MGSMSLEEFLGSAQASARAIRQSVGSEIIDCENNRGKDYVTLDRKVRKRVLSDGLYQKYNNPHGVSSR